MSDILWESLIMGLAFGSFGALVILSFFRLGKGVADGSGTITREVKFALNPPFIIAGVVLVMWLFQNL